MISRKKPISYLEKRRRRCGALCAERKKILTHSTSLLPLKNYYILCKKKLTNRGFLSSKIIISCVFFCQIKINIFFLPQSMWHYFVKFQFHEKKTIETLVISLFISEAIKTKLNDINQIEHNM